MRIENGLIYLFQLAPSSETISAYVIIADFEDGASWNKLIHFRHQFLSIFWIYDEREVTLFYYYINSPQKRHPSILNFEHFFKWLKFLWASTNSL